MKANLVCKGGGVKGIALVGAISYLENNGYEWDKLAGSSVGAIVSSLLAVGYTSNEIKDLLYNIDYTCFRDKNKLHSIPIIGEFLSISIHKGLHSGNYIENFLEEKFKAKGKTKFKDISINGESKLKIIAVDVTRKKLLVLPDDLIEYNIDPMEFDISKAVRMSLSIPLYYYPVKLKYNKKSYFIVDGGLLSNFPLWVIDDTCTTKYPTFGLNLIDDPKEDTHKFTNTISYLLDIAQTSLLTNEDVYFKEKDFVRIINIPTFDINATNFDITNKEMEHLYISGYKSAQLFLNNWNFERYISKYGL